MKKTTLLSILASGALLFGTAIPTLAVAADSTANSNATVSFKQGNTGPTDPVDPEDPTEPGDGGGTENPGPLSIDYVSAFDFGDHDVPTKTETYKAAGENGNADYVQITDQRAGDPAGWTLSVAQDGQLKSSTGDTLIGAAISFGEGTVKTTSEDDPATVTSSTNGSALATDGSSMTVMSAKAGNGFGTWLDVFGSADDSTVKLTVPVSAHPDADSYSGTLNWTLNETPGNA